MRSYRKWLRGDKSVIDENQAQRILARGLSGDLSEDMKNLKALFSQTPDLIIRNIRIHKTRKRAFLIYLDGLVDKNSINSHVLNSLLHEDLPEGEEACVPIGHIETVKQWPDIEDRILQGCSLLFLEGDKEAFVYATQGWPQRAISDPQRETSIKGSHQGFVETAGQNIALIRRYIPNRELKMKECHVGERGKAKISILYLADVVNPELLQEMEERVQRIAVDSVLNTGELEEFIEDHPFSPFPHFIVTERPDAVASHLLQGRIAVVLDRSPGVLIGPTTLTTFFQSVDDYNVRWIVASFIRVVRFVSFLVAIFLPALYIAVISFNYEIIPVDLIISIGESRERVPFPPVMEALIMEITLEMLREAGIRLPAPIGQTVGIVGGIVIGQAAVEAGIVSNIMVIVVALTAIASFIIPNYDMASAIRLLRFPMMIISSMFGIVGMVIGMMTLLAHLVTMQSLGTTFTAPLAPVKIEDWKDTFIRFPLWKMNNRPRSTIAIQRRKQGTNRSEGEG